jgi:hypothetical protein
MRLCYEHGLARNGNLTGKVMTRFVIGTDGAAKAEFACTSMPGDVAVDCIVGEFGKLRFPIPDGGPVTAVAPIIFHRATIARS